MKIYIAGPMTGIPDFNFPEFRKATDYLRARGFNVVSPHEVTESTDGKDAPRDKPWSFYMRNSLKAMLDCDEVLMLPLWPKSHGARLERDLALSLSMPIHYHLQEFEGRRGDG